MDEISRPKPRHGPAREEIEAPEASHTAPGNTDRSARLALIQSQVSQGTYRVASEEIAAKLMSRFGVNTPELPVALPKRK